MSVYKRKFASLRANLSRDKLCTARVSRRSVLVVAFAAPMATVSVAATMSPHVPFRIW